MCNLVWHFEVFFIYLMNNYLKLEQNASETQITLL